jgi:hypothetical protein
LQIPLILLFGILKQGHCVRVKSLESEVCLRISIGQLDHEYYDGGVAPEYSSNFFQLNRCTRRKRTEEWAGCDNGA